MTTVTRVLARPGLAPRMAKVSSGSLGGTFWGPEGRAPLGLDSPPLLPASDTATEGCSESPPNSGGSSWRLGFHLPSPSPSAGPGGQNFSSFAQRAHSALRPAEPPGPVMSPASNGMVLWRESSSLGVIHHRIPLTEAVGANSERGGGAQQAAIPPGSSHTQLCTAQGL